MQAKALDTEFLHLRHSIGIIHISVDDTVSKARGVILGKHGITDDNNGVGVAACQRRNLFKIFGRQYFKRIGVKHHVV